MARHPRTAPPVTRASAEAIAAAIRATWPAFLADGAPGPVVYGHEHEQQPAGAWSIAWEGGSPEDWPRLFCDLAYLGKVAIPHGVFPEPIHSCALGLYRGEPALRPAGGPAVCQWFLTCTRAATGTVAHPVLGDVPACEQCTTLAGH